MPIIDNKGFIHIFKWKINIIDLGVIIFILVAFAWPAYYGIKLAKAQKIPASELPKYVTQEEYDKIVNQRDLLQYKINNYLKKHKRASKYFK